MKVMEKEEEETILKRGRDGQTDRQTDRQTDGDNYLASHILGKNSNDNGQTNTNSHKN